jgi:hypothetical protein
MNKISHFYQDRLGTDRPGKFPGIKRRRGVFAGDPAAVAVLELDVRRPGHSDAVPRVLNVLGGMAECTPGADLRFMDPGLTYVDADDPDE